MAVKTTSTTTARYIESKPRKIPHKDKPKKYKAPKRKDVDQTDDQPETTTVLEARTVSPDESFPVTVSKSPTWIHLLKNGSANLYSTKYCCFFVIFVFITCYMSVSI